MRSDEPLAGHSAQNESALAVRLATPLTIAIFLLHPLRVWLRPEDVLRDPGVGWHLATGRYILDTLSIPGHDLFSWTAADREWISYYWLFEVIAAFLVKLGGLPLYAMVCTLFYALLPVFLLRRMLRSGAGLAPAILSTLAAYVVLLSHAVARPHVVTYVFFAVLLERLDRYYRGELPARSLWWIPVMAMAWCNMHGGFVAGLVLTGIFAAVAGLRAVLLRDRQEQDRAVVFACLAAAMVLATVINPNGVRLHLSIAEHLRMHATSQFHEFGSPAFVGGGAAVTAFEGMAVLLVLLFWRRARGISWMECVLAVFFLDQALRSVRHMNLFAIVAAPIIAREVTSMLDGIAPRLQRYLAPIAASQRASKGQLVAFCALWMAFVGLALADATPFPRTLEGLQLSKGAAEYIEGHKDRFLRMFNTDNLGGSLIYRFWPDLKVFVDDRIFVYGDDFIMRKYLPVLHVEPRWQDVLYEYQVTAAVVATGTPCATVFRESPQWRLEFEDDLTTIFLKEESIVAAPRSR